LLDELGTALVQGRRAGTVVPDGVLSRLDWRLLRNKVALSRGADDLLAEAGAGGMFRVYKDGSATIFLRSNPTRYELLHELKHYEHFLDVGADAFKGISRLNQEQFVFDALRRSHHWAGFTAAEQAHALRYIRSLGGR